MKLQPITPFLGIEVHHVDLRKPVADDDFATLREALNQHSVLLFRDQTLSEADHVSFSRRFGPLLTHVLAQFLKPGFPEIYVLSNVVDGGKPIGNHKEGWNWHSDLSYKAEPCLGSLLYAIETPPEGADTLFASMYAAFDALDDDTRDLIRTLRGVHSYSSYYGKAFADRTPLSSEQKAAVPDITHPLVRTHPETGRLSLYVGEDVVSGIEGMEGPEGQALLARLNAHAMDSRFVYRHVWQPGDLLIWDNRSTMHRATPYDDVKYRRVMHRTTVAGDRPF
jgi:taurine dioxygenase